MFGNGGVKLGPEGINGMGGRAVNGELGSGPGDRWEFLHVALTGTGRISKWGAAYGVVI